jgi:hypothetical protein
VAAVTAIGDVARDQNEQHGGNELRQAHEAKIERAVGY